MQRTVCLLQTYCVISPLIQKYCSIKLIRVWTLDTWWRSFCPVLTYRLLKQRVSCWLYGDAVVSAGVRMCGYIRWCMSKTCIARDLWKCVHDGKSVSCHGYWLISVSPLIKTTSVQNLFMIQQFLMPVTTELNVKCFCGRDFYEWMSGFVHQWLLLTQYNRLAW